MKNSICVSVVIPVFNTEKYLKECIGSITNQTLKEIEIICIDDGSTDNSLAVLHQLALTDLRIKVIVPGGNHGQAFARNRGVETAVGEYIVYVDSDDILGSDDVLEKLYKAASEQDLDILVFGADAIYEMMPLNDTKFCLKQYNLSNGIMTGEKFICETLNTNQFIPNVWTKIWKRSFIADKSIRFREDTSPHEDLLYVFEAFMTAQKVEYIDEICYYYRWRAGSSTSVDFSLKRLHAYVLIYHYLIKAFEKNKLDDDALNSMFLYTKTIKKIIQTKSTELIKSGVDVYSSAFDNNFYKYLMFEIITEKYQYISKPLSVSEYQQLMDSTMIYVYGAGTMGREIMDFISDYGLDYTPVVTRKNKVQKVNGKNVLEFSEVKKNNNDIYIIAVNDICIKDEIVKNLNSNGVTNIMHLR